jgi:hypothetical protein
MVLPAERNLGFAYSRGLFHSTVIIKQNIIQSLLLRKAIPVSGKKRKFRSEENEKFVKKQDTKVSEHVHIDLDQPSQNTQSEFLLDRRKSTINAYALSDSKAEIRVESYIALRERKAKKDLERKELQEKIRGAFESKIKGMSHEQMLRFLCPEASEALSKNKKGQLRKLIIRKLAEYHPDKHVSSSLESILDIEEKYKLLLTLRDHFSP